jgi:hypothetical protein
MGGIREMLAANAAEKDSDLSHGLGAYAVEVLTTVKLSAQDQSASNETVEAKLSHLLRGAKARLREVDYVALLEKLAEDAAKLDIGSQRRITKAIELAN